MTHAMTHEKIRRMCLAALLCAVGILVPVLSPVKLQLGPMSFTLGSHVAVFLAMFISPGVGLAVEAGTTLGFVLAGFPPVVVLRAAAQIVFVAVGAYRLRGGAELLNRPARAAAFGLALGVIHGVCEALVVAWFWFGGSVSGSFWSTVIGLVGVGTLVHSMADYYIALAIWAPARRLLA